MNFREFATKNVHRNIKAYFAYFLSSSISASLLFSFAMLIFHPDFVVLKLPQYLKNTFNMTTVIAYLFLCFFVFYSVSVFLKSRYKEFGILYILGSSKKQIQRMISIENIIISSVSAIVGIIVGVVFSKILLAASGKLLGYNALAFYLPVKAMLITFIAFVMIGIVNSALCSFIIKEDKVLSLLKGTKKPRPEPKSSVILVIICIVLLTIGYYLSITASMKTITYRIIPVTIIVIAATYFLFSQLSVFVMKLLKKNRNLYMKKTTVLWVSNLLYRIRDNTRMFFLITITSTVALTSIGAVYAYWRDKEGQINANFPQAFFCSNREDNKTRADFIESSLKKEGVDYTKVKAEMKIVIPKGYKDEVVVMKENVYKQLASTLSLDTIIFNKNETVVAAPLVGYERRKIILDNIELDVVGKSDKRVIPTLYGDVYVIKDNVYEKIKGVKIYFWAFNVKNYNDTLSICQSYYNNFEIDSKGTQNISLLKAHILESTKIAYGIILFSTIFIGLIFFVTTGSFLYNKCYMDILEDKRKYKQLNKIGLTYKEIKKILTIEIGILFLFPYIIAMIHSFFALSALKYAFGIEITAAAFVVMGSMMLVQIIYFIIIRKNYLIEIRKSLL
ncbi:ABC transporter permease [Clostridium sp.]|jgi:putative ABC transport system permease protein|uniref:FtsX-like permease family protein n=1 Tax=Clostridium sp. TaxID=1506 RepID=UPI00258372BB|nr:ABC transporter permease [Clostridium sp.]MDF2503248.1 peptide transporter permease [Clostridium sp.]